MSFCGGLYIHRSRLLIKSKINKRPSCTLLCQAQACNPSWGRLAGRGQIETRQRGDDELEHQFQENDTQYSTLLSHRVLTVGLMFVRTHGRSSGFPAFTSMSVLYKLTFIQYNLIHFYCLTCGAVKENYRAIITTEIKETKKKIKYNNHVQIKPQLVTVM